MRVTPAALAVALALLLALVLLPDVGARWCPYITPLAQTCVPP
jgi:hypothetical protein